MLKENLKLIEISRQLISEVYYDSKKAHDFLFENHTNKKHELISGLLINKAISSYNCLRAFYYSNLNELSDSRIDEILSKFSTFGDEFLSNISTDHSHQWTNITFNELKDSITEIFGDIQ